MPKATSRQVEVVTELNETIEGMLVLLEEEDDASFSDLIDTLREIKQELEEVLESHD